ncbi:uncharacterized protein LOC123527829 [Mercenaria mercenaria]|uniref:uncharacterized protein LOC123527829 n=1 Tax=Mercenaria mercenaria TaxID=6596 RepID=UPI00234F9D66|nr:uncharacterized protein LOC123527829 [Mercenaria mercenaria]
MAYSRKLTESKYHNWVKASLAVLFTKEGIQPFVHDEIEQFQQKCLTDICSNNGLPVGTTCSSCYTENIIVCPTNRICNAGRGKCSFHRNAATRYNPVGCPNIVCNNFKTEIQNAHRYNGPSYRNTDATQWNSNPWEVAKCFMPPDGYKDVASAADTDFNGIISVIANHKGFQKKTQANLDDKNNIFEHGRQIGKTVRHSPKLEVDDADLQLYFRYLKDLLSDPGHLGSDRYAQSAIQKLTQLQNNTLVIRSDDVRRVLEEVAKAIQDKIKNEMDKLKKIAEEEKLKLITDSVHAIKSQEDMSVSDLKQSLSDALNEIERKTQQSVDIIRTETEQQKTTASRKIESGVEDGLEKIKAKTCESIELIGKKNTEERHDELMREFKVDLVTFNNKRHSSIPLSPLFEEIDTPLLDFYVMPDMFTCVRKERTKIQSLKEVFFKQEEKCNEIYITADAGFGKTAFSKRLVMTWCQAQRPDDSNDRYFSQEDISAMKCFDFLFLVSLRDADKNCNIDDMIVKQIVQHLGLHFDYTAQFLEKILSRKSCLIILDGLDEWIHSTSSTCTKGVSQIPHRNERKDATIVTTTRPWKLSVLNIKNSEIDKTIELAGLNKESERKLKINAISKINDKTRDEINAQVQKFDDEIKQKAINDFQNIPLLLLYMICLWSEGKELGRSMSDFYSRVIELLLSRGVKTFKMQPRKANESNIPKCFMEQETCITYYQFLKGLGELAFQTLFCFTRENTLVFDASVAKRFLSDEYLKFSLKSGILTQSKEQGLISQKSKVSFAHKSMQEFFAALSIYHMPDQENAMESVRSVCKDIDSILQMKMVFSFLSGISLRSSGRLFQMIMDVVAADSRTQQYRSSSFIWNHNIIQPLKSIQNMYIDFISENTQNGAEVTCLHLQDFIIDNNCKDAKYSSALSKLLSINKGNIKSICIKTVEGIPDFHQVMRDFNLYNTRGLEKVFYRSDIIGDEIKMLLNGSLNTLKYLAVTSHKWDEDVSCCWSDALSCQLESMQYLQGIAFDGFVMEHNQFEKLMDYLKQKPSLLEISLYNLKCTDHGKTCNGCGLDLSTNTGLKLLRLNSIPLSDLDISVTSLESCDVGKLGIITKYLQQLPFAHNLNTFLCSFQESASDIDAMLKTLPMLGGLEVIKLRKMNIGDKMLELPSAVENIILLNVTMTSNSLEKLIKTLESHQQSVSIEIIGCTIVPGHAFETLKTDIRKSDLFVVKEDGLDENSQHSFVFETSSGKLLK